MTIASILPMGGFYQFGFVTRDLDAAARTLEQTFGVTRYRRKFSSPWMEAIHAWTGETMIEVLQLGPEAPQMYHDYVPEQAGELRLQHIGRRIENETQWAALEAAVAGLGLDMPMNASVMEGKLRAMYVDTRALLGIYTEYVMVQGELLHMYDDIPQNLPITGFKPVQTVAG